MRLPALRRLADAREVGKTLNVAPAGGAAAVSKIVEAAESAADSVSLRNLWAIADLTGQGLDDLASALRLVSASGAPAVARAVDAIGRARAMYRRLHDLPAAALVASGTVPEVADHILGQRFAEFGPPGVQGGVTASVLVRFGLLPRQQLGVERPPVESASSAAATRNDPPYPGLRWPPGASRLPPRGGGPSGRRRRATPPAPALLGRSRRARSRQVFLPPRSPSRRCRCPTLRRSTSCGYPAGRPWRHPRGACAPPSVLCGAATGSRGTRAGRWTGWTSTGSRRRTSR